MQCQVSFLTVSAVAMCVHGGKANFLPNPTVTIMGQPVAMYEPGVPLIMTPCANPPPPVGTGPAVTAMIAEGFTTQVLCDGMPLLTISMMAEAIPCMGPVMVEFRARNRSPQCRYL